MTYFATYTHRAFCDHGADAVDATTGFGTTLQAAHEAALANILASCIGDFEGDVRQALADAEIWAEVTHQGVVPSV